MTHIDHDQHSHEALIRYARWLGFGEIHTRIDNKTGLNAIIALHSNTLGPAIGGCRHKHYDNTSLALADSLRLAYMMTLKNAVAQLPHGGAKAVLIKPKVIRDRPAYFHAFADFINELNGRYVTSVDVGSTGEDMALIAERTPYVIGATSGPQKLADTPSTYTALGVLRGIQASVKHKLQRDDLDGLRVAIQGAGHVGTNLTRLLIERGAHVTISDRKPQALVHIREQFQNVSIVDDLNTIYDVDCDVFSPCALGSSITLDTIQRIKAPIIAGAANNQLSHSHVSHLLQERGVLYAPDFVINSGGVIYAAMMYGYNDANKATTKVDTLYDTMRKLYQRADSEQQATTDIAQSIALERLQAAEDQESLPTE